MKSFSLYDIKLGCQNCGQADFYQVPLGYEFLEFEHKERHISGKHQYSRLRRGLDQEMEPEKRLNCNNCRMPYLNLVGWDKRLEPPIHPVGTHDNFGRSSDH